MLLLLLLKIVEQVEKKENRMESDIIKISHLTKNFGEVKAVNDLNFRLKEENCLLSSALMVLERAQQFLLYVANFTRIVEVWRLME